MRTRTIIGLFLFAAFARDASACSSVSLNARGYCQPHTADCAFTGHNFDWYVDKGFAFVEPRGVAKSAFLVDKTRKPLTWTSKFGSLAFSPGAPGFTISGVNEAGLSVTVMQVPSFSSSFSASTLPAVSELQFPQYLLDSASTVSEAVQRTLALRLSITFFPLHFFVCDRHGDCAALEYIEDNWVIHQGNDLPVAALTNSSYENSVDSWNRYSTDWMHLLPQDESLARFVKLGEAVASYQGQESAVNYMFRALAKVRARGKKFMDVGTRLSTVYAKREGRGGGPDITAYYSTRLAPGLRTISLEKLDFRCGQPLLALDMNLSGSQDMSGHFSTFTDQDQAALDLQTSAVGVSAQTISELRLYLQSAPANCAL